MKKICCTILLAICLLGFAGCHLVESAVSDVGGWNLSACVDGFWTCTELVWDNYDKFDGSFVEAVGNLTQP